MEQTLGHVTHHRNLACWMGQRDEIAPLWMPVPFEQRDLWQRAPLTRGNWTLRASLRARRQVRAAIRTSRNQPLEGLFYHTQVTALFSTQYARSLPTVVSLDATPINVDSVGHAYDHAPSRSGRLEAIKDRLNRRTFRSARRLVTWCEWARDSLVADYGVPAERITVIPPGVDLGRWRFAREPRKPGGRTRLLFVGGDFRRKGGELLLRAYRASLANDCELDIVTRDPVDIQPGESIRVHHGLTPNSKELTDLYAAADVFAFPTLGDCLPIAVMEAMAAGLPVVATSVGALREEVAEGRTGFLVPPGDVEAFAERTVALVRSPAKAREMGDEGRLDAEVKFDGARNYGRLIALILETVREAG